MGYDLHITRKGHWADEGPNISVDEWLAVVASDPEMRLDPSNGPNFALWSRTDGAGDGWLDWNEGNIFTKNPDNAFIAKMAAIAKQLGAQVQGDEGERYDHDGQPQRETARSFLARAARWFGRIGAPAPPETKPIDVPFRVGDRVKDAWGREATVIQIDRQAEHGLGTLRTRDDDGKESTYLLLAHGLKPIAQKAEP
jgi:hypothetical protein